MIKDHLTAHKNLLQTYRPLWGARAGSILCGGLLATSIMGAPDPQKTAVAMIGAVMLALGYLLGFPTRSTRKAMQENWCVAFKGTEWKTIGGEVATVLETNEYGNEVRLAFNRVTSAKTFRIESLAPASERSRRLAAAVAIANPYDKRFHPAGVMFGVLVLMIVGALLLPDAVAIGYLWLVFSGACHVSCGLVENVRSDDETSVRRLSKTKWRVLDGRVGFIRFVESRGTQDSGYTDYLTVGFGDGSEYCAEKSEMVPVHDQPYAPAA